jgi:hypothetical protein
VAPNSSLLDATLADVARLMAAMLQGRDGRRASLVVASGKSRQAKTGGPTCLPIRVVASESGAPI